MNNGKRSKYGFMFYFSHNDEYIEKEYYVNIIDLSNCEYRLGENN